MGDVVARSDHSPHATVVDEQIFAFVTEHEIRSALRLRYPVSLLTILPDVEGAGEPGAPDAVADQLARALSPIFRATDLIRRSGDAPVLRLLLVNAPLEALPGMIRRLTVEVDAHRFLVDGDRKAVRLSVGGACFPTTAGTAEELVSRADTLAAEARQNDDPGGSRYRLR